MRSWRPMPRPSRRRRLRPDRRRGGASVTGRSALVTTNSSCHPNPGTFSPRGNLLLTRRLPIASSLRPRSVRPRDEHSPHSTVRWSLISGIRTSSVFPHRPQFTSISSGSLLVAIAPVWLSNRRAAARAAPTAAPFLSLGSVPEPDHHSTVYVYCRPTHDPFRLTHDIPALPASSQIHLPQCV